MAKPSFKEEKLFWSKGYQYVIGVDEVGRGAFAGPVVVGAVLFKKDLNEFHLDGVNDSKLLSYKKREKLNVVIKDKALFYLTAQSSTSIINKYGVGKATQTAFRKVIRAAQNKLGTSDIFVLVDGFYIPYLRGIGIKNQKAIIKGDRKSFSIAAASIIAKVKRDRQMKNLHKKYPEYGFDRNKGYGTLKHRLAIKKYGLSKIHRKSFNLSRFLV